MRDPRSFQFDLPVTRPSRTIPLHEKIHAAAWRAAPTVSSARTGDPLQAVSVVVVHATAGSSSEGAISVMTDGRASFHWIVPDENENAHQKFVWATAPERRAAWHVRNNCSHPAVCDGAKGINQRSLGIELVNAQSGKDPFSPWQIKSTAQIIHYAWAKYPNLRHVVSHARLDPARRTDPGSDFPWERLEESFLTLAFGCER